MADKIKNVSKKSPKELTHKMRMNQKNQKKDMYLEKKDNKLLMN